MVLVESTVISVGVRLKFNRQSVGHWFSWNFRDLISIFCHWYWLKWKPLYSSLFDDWVIQRHLQRGSSRICNCTSYNSYTSIQLRHILRSSGAMLIISSPLFTLKSELFTNTHRPEWFPSRSRLITIIFRAWWIYLSVEMETEPNRHIMLVA